MPSLNGQKSKSRLRRRRFVDVRRPYPLSSSDDATPNEGASPRKVYVYKPRGRRTRTLINKVLRSFSWHTVGIS